MSISTLDRNENQVICCKSFSQILKLRGKLSFLQVGKSKHNKKGTRAERRIYLELQCCSGFTQFGHFTKNKGGQFSVAEDRESKIVKNTAEVFEWYRDKTK